MKTVILAGGAGTRLRPVIADVPKPMARIAGRPFLEFIVDRLVQGGLTDIVMSVGYRAQAISNHFGTEWGGATISYAVETEPLGTGGAVAQAVRGWPNRPMLIVNGDSYLEIDYGDLIAWANAGSALTPAMAVCRVQDISRYGSVQCVDGVVRAFVEKGSGVGPGLINAGIYVLSPTVFSKFGLSGRFSLESDLLQPHIGVLRPRAYVSNAFFIDIGMPEDFLRAQATLARHSKRD